MTDPASDSIGRIVRRPLREVWRHEARDFTTWLENNVEVLNEVLDFELESVEREQAAGAFSVDLVGTDSQHRRIVIENQLEKSDHDHLGKVVTYLAALEAKAAVWIVAEPRPEHTGAITWLNESIGTDFYLIKVEAIRIDNSKPAPLFTLITGPSLETKQVAATKSELTERHKLRLEFWGGLLEMASETPLNQFSGISPSAESWIQAGAGRSGVHWIYRVRQADSSVELAFEGPDFDLNRRRLDRLREDKNKIESEFGSPLEWDFSDGRKRCSIRHTLPGGGYRVPEGDWSRVQSVMVDSMESLVRTLRPRLGPLSD